MSFLLLLAHTYRCDHPVEILHILLSAWKIDGIMGE